MMSGNYGDGIEKFMCPPTKVINAVCLLKIRELMCHWQYVCQGSGNS